MTFTATSGSIARLSTATDRLPDLPDLASSATGLRDWIKACWAEDDFAAAVAIASPHLAEAALAGDATERDVRRTATSLARYLLRHRSRATPFGAWAACLPARIGPATALEPPAKPALIHHTAPDTARPGVGFGATLVCRNPLAFERLTCIVLPWAPASFIEEAPGTVTVQRTAPLSTLWDAAREPITVDDLTARVKAAHPGLSDRACHRVIAGLIGHRLLLTANAASIIAPAPCVPGPAVSAITNATYEATTVTVPKPVAHAAARAAEVLLRLSPHPEGDPAWRDYHRRWLDRYSLGHIIALPRLLDGAAELGPPPGYRGSALPPPAPAFGERDRRLLTLAEQTLLNGETTLHLTDALIDELQQGEVTAPPCAEVTLTVAAGSPEEVERGAFTATVRTVSPSLFHSAGRHLTYLDPAATEAAREALKVLRQVHPDWQWAQTAPAPLADDLADLAAHPRLLDTLIPIGEHPRGAALRPDQIGVTGDAERLWALDLKTGAPLRVLTFNAIEPVKYQHPATRFLTELTTAFDTALGPWAWGAAGSLPVLPRVQYGQVVLAPARWRLDPALTDPGQDFDCWDRDLTAWRERTGMARFVTVGETDVRYTLDLEQPNHRRLLHIEQRRDRTLLLQEAPVPGTAGWITSRAHEINIPLIAKPTRPAPAPRPHGPAPAAVVAPPGAGRWWSLHLFTDTAEAERLITRHLPALTSQLGSWGAWYLHYTEPAPHLRLRLPRTGPGDLDVIAAWVSDLLDAAQIADCHLATYRPETARYGPGPLLAAAETLFCADAVCAAAILEATEPSSPGREAAAAASLVHLAESMHQTPEAAWAWLVGHIDQTAPASITTTRADRDRARRTLALARRLHAAPAAIGTSWPARRAAAIAYRDHHRRTAAAPDLDAVTAAFLHLACNRVVGLEPDAELRLLHYARSLALTAHHQQRHQGHR